MRSPNSKLCGAVIAAVLALAAAVGSAGQKLGDILRDSKWDRIIGTWVDADSKGTKFTITYAWKFADTLIEVTGKEGDKETVSLIGVNGKTGEVYNVAANNQGTASLGKWEVEDGDAVLTLGYVTAEGREGGLKIRHHLEDDDTLVVTLELPEPVKVKLVRVKTGK